MRSARFLAAFTVLLVLGQSTGHAQIRKNRVRRPAAPKVEAPRDPETSSDEAFKPTELTKVALLVANDQGRGSSQTNAQRVVEDEFIRLLILKGHTVVSRSDLQAVMKEQGFQKSGMTTEDNAAQIGKLLNVPAVLVVKINEFATQPANNPRNGRPMPQTRASLGSRLIDVQNGAVLWTGTHDVSRFLGPNDSAMIALADAAAALVWAFPSKNSDETPLKKGARPKPPLVAATDPTLDPKALTKLAVIMADGSSARGGLGGVGSPRRDAQSNEQRAVEDEFLQTFIHKGFRLVSRSDIQVVAKEQRFAHSGLTAENAVALGKMLNVPAVMVVRITDYSIDTIRDPASGRPGRVARVALGARLVGVESGLILWVGTAVESHLIGGNADGLAFLTAAAKTLANTFPSRSGEVATTSPGGKGPAVSPAGASSTDASFDPSAMTRLAVIVVKSGRGLAIANRIDSDSIIEDAFVQALLRKRYKMVSRSDLQAILREKQFKQSGLTEDDAKEVGKLLNIPAVLVVRMTQVQVDERGLSATMGARLISVESGLILWTASHTERLPGGQREVARLVNQASKALANQFPEKTGSPKPEK